jgi:hypothetical protein
MEEKYLEKLGRTPKTIYRLIFHKAKNGHQISKAIFTTEEASFLKNEFLVVTDSGNLLEGSEAFIYWCN